MRSEGEDEYEGIIELLIDFVVITNELDNSRKSSSSASGRIVILLKISRFLDLSTLLKFESASLMHASPNFHTWRKVFPVDGGHLVSGRDVLFRLSSRTD